MTYKYLAFVIEASVRFKLCTNCSSESSWPAPDPGGRETFMLEPNSCHISDHDLERYYLGMVREEGELAAIEKHLLACPDCVERAEQSDRYVDAMRRALTLSGVDDDLPENPTVKFGQSDEFEQ